MSSNLPDLAAGIDTSPGRNPPDRRHRRFLGRLNMRLSFIFSAVFLLGSALLFAATFFSLLSNLQEDDLSHINARLLGFWAQFQSGGIDRIVQEIQVENLMMGERPYFVRISDADNNTLVQRYPLIWQNFNFNRLTEVRPDSSAALITLGASGVDYRLEVAGIRLSGQYYLQVGMSTQSRKLILDLFQRNFFAISALLIVLSFLAGLFISSRTFKPVGQLNRTIRSIISTGKTDARIPISGSHDELGELVVYFNEMLARIDRLIREMRNSLDSVAHDLRTPLTRLRGVAELALKGDENITLYREALEGALEEADVILRMLNTLMDISEAESGVMRLRIQPVPLHTLIEELADLYRFTADEKGVEITTDVSAPLSIPGDPVRLRQVIGNLLDNAVKYTPEGGVVAVSLNNDRDDAIVAVKDTGIGIPEDEIPRIWTRLYRSRSVPTVPGLGLGLSLVKAIVEAHEGRVSVASAPGAGTTVEVRLPLSRKQPT
ncbi:MAG TPA: ATP-binding protein [Spirochaetia bacterium]|nr:ATP-binding protein [Spirochaetia bacterium]